MRTSAWIILIADGKALLLQRSKTANNPGLWNFPGGNVDPGEQPGASAIREAFEEAGLRISRTALRRLKPIVTSQRKMIFYLVKRSKRPVVRINHESAKYKWCSLNTFPAKLHEPTRLLYKRILKAQARKNAS